MSEQEIREGMLLAVWDEPPLDFDPDSLIRRAEQKKSRRRALVGVGVASVVIIASAVALPGLLPRGDGTELATSNPTSTSASSSETEDQRGQRIGDALAENLALRMPEFKEVYADFNRRLLYPPLSSTYPSSRAKQTPTTDLTGYVHLNDAIGPTSLAVIGGHSAPLDLNLCQYATYCKELPPQKDGSIVTEAEYVDQSSKITRAVTLRKFTSGYVVQITSFAYNPATGSGIRETVPVRVGVLTELVTDPRINWE